MDRIIDTDGFILFSTGDRYEINCCSCTEGSPYDTRSFTKGQLQEIHDKIGQVLRKEK